MLPHGDSLRSLPRDARSHGWVLVVDDDATMRAMVGLVITAEFDCLVAHAADGAEALERLWTSDTLPCVVICDLEMPRLDGLSFIRSVRATPHLARMPIMVMSASEIDRNTIITTGADYYLPKPFDLRHFLAVLGQFIPPSTQE